MSRKKHSMGADRTQSGREPAQALGGFDAGRTLRDREGRVLIRTKARVLPRIAAILVAEGAALAYEGCGCGGWSGCQPEWVDQIPPGRPRFAKRFGSPTWIDLWEGEDGMLVMAHGDVEWGGVFRGR